MNYASVVEQLVTEYDLRTEAGRRAAYERCDRYAEEHYEARVEYNAFMAAVGARLGLPAVRRNTFEDSVGEIPDDARVYLNCAEGNPELFGNPEGLRYVAAIMMELAAQAIEGDHAHLFEYHPPMHERSDPLTITHVPDEWFAALDRKEDDGEEDEPEERTARDIEPGDVVALCVLEETPPRMPITQRRLYRVRGVEPFRGQKLWQRRIRDENDRLFVFTVVNDDGTPEPFAFDLDDPKVLFLSREDLAPVADAERPHS